MASKKDLDGGKTIVCKVNEELTITLKNVKEVYGHDDSLPFNADLYIRNGAGKRSKLTAYCSNDGWGGETDIQAVDTAARETLNKVNEFIKDNYKCVFNVNNQEHFFVVTLEFLVSIMAEYSIYRDINSFNLSYVKDIVKK